MIPGPTNVPDRVMKAMQRPVISHRGSEFHELYKRITEGLKYAFQTEKCDVFPLTCSGTGGVECAVGNVISRGDKVVMLTYGEFGDRMKEAIERFGGEPITVEAEWGNVCDLAEVERALEKNKDAKAVALVYNETSTGVTNRDLPKIGEMAEGFGQLLIVDAISVIAGDWLKVDDWKIDVCIAGSQKCLACPPGLAMVSVSERAYEAIERNKSRPFYFDLLSCRKFAEKSETPFTPAIPLFYALDEALAMLKEEGLEARIARHRECASAFYRALEAMGLEILPPEAVRSNTVVAVKIPEGAEDAKVRDLMKKKHGVLIAGGMGKLKGKIFRIGSMGIVTKEMVARTVRALADALTETTGRRYDAEAALSAMG